LACARNRDILGQIHMPKTYHCAIEVRGYELDSFGHVNHAVYISYLEHARWKLLEEEGIGLKEFNAWKRWPVIAALEATYLKPTFLGENLEVRTSMQSVGRTSFEASQEIYRGDTAVFKAKVHVVIVNENGRPAELPAELSRLST
jgi:YbgC/YbaW family acyl-CoA thioester hydrolase